VKGWWVASAELVLPKLKHMGYRIAWNHRNGFGVFPFTTACRTRRKTTDITDCPEVSRWSDFFMSEFLV